MANARERIRELRDRRRLRLPVEQVVQDVNRFLRGWAGYFRFGNSAQAFDKITFHALVRVGGFVTNRHKQRGGYGWWVISQSPDRLGLIKPLAAPTATDSWQ
jgi:RNA-directed DNA polymerase